MHKPQSPLLGDVQRVLSNGLAVEVFSDPSLQLGAVRVCWLQQSATLLVSGNDVCPLACNGPVAWQFLEEIHRWRRKATGVQGEALC